MNTNRIVLTRKRMWFQASPNLKYRETIEVPVPYSFLLTLLHCSVQSVCQLGDPDFPPAIRNPNQPELATVALSKRNRFNEQWKSFQSKSLQGQRSLLDLLDLLACQSSNKGSGWIISMSESIQFLEKQHTILGRLAVPFAQDEPELPSPWAPWLGFILII